MANRSYLYTTDHLPGSPEWEERRNLHSISEWNYDIPIAFKLLLTGTPIAVRSSIWNSPDDIAIAGEAAPGLERLKAYLALLPTEAQTLVQQAVVFFSRAENVRHYFVLECGEIFDMRGEDLKAQNEQLLAEIRELPSDVTALPIPSLDPAPSGLFKRIFSRRAPKPPRRDPMEDFYRLGLGNWSNILYYQFSKSEA